MDRAGLEPSEILMVGDSLVSDIAGAREAGIDSVWYNPYSLENLSKISADYEIEDLHELAGILNS